MSNPPTIPVLLLKTRSQPHDAYEEYFSTSRTPEGEDASPIAFLPRFVPVLEHRPNSRNLAVLEESLRDATLSETYGGMIFTSQRAVEAWAEVVKKVERSSAGYNNASEDGRVERRGTSTSESQPPGPGAPSAPTFSVPVEDDSQFPLYTVGPATSRTLKTLVAESTANEQSPFARLDPSVLGEHTGNGGDLAQYILSHYNKLHSQKPLSVGEEGSGPGPGPATALPPSSSSASPLQTAPTQDEQVARPKKKLLFLVGEQRRDIIPKTLTDVQGNLAPEDRILVDEVEVYATEIMHSFQDEFRTAIDLSERQGRRFVVVVVFSPQGCEAMLRCLGFIDRNNALTQRAKDRWSGSGSEEGKGKGEDEGQGEQGQSYIIVTIGPTTRDHLKNKFGFEADVCAARPSPQGVGNGLDEFLDRTRLLG